MTLLATQTTFLINKIVNSVPVVGYSVFEQTTVKFNSTFEKFALLKLPCYESDEILKAQKKQANFVDLERTLNNRRSDIKPQGGAKQNEPSATLPSPFVVINEVSGGNNE